MDDRTQDVHRVFEAETPVGLERFASLPNKQYLA
jgi:hypothetical protein